MSDCVRTPISASGTKSDTAIMLSDIFERYSVFEPMVQNRRVAAKVSSYSDQHSWSWRYLVSVRNGTLAPSRFIVAAIKKCWDDIHGFPPLIPAPACPTCGGACTYDCGTQRPTAKPGQGRQRPKRTEICAGTELSEIIRRVYAVTGHKLAPIEGEIEY